MRTIDSSLSLSIVIFPRPHHRRYWIVIRALVSSGGQIHRQIEAAHSRLSGAGSFASVTTIRFIGYFSSPVICADCSTRGDVFSSSPVIRPDLQCLPGSDPDRDPVIRRPQRPETSTLREREPKKAIHTHLRTSMHLASLPVGEP